jgi:phosphatidylglycerol:prolipoprotein diacylglycerol transferase
MAGCCCGKPTNVFWAITLHGIKMHPTQIYQSVFCLIILVFITVYKKGFKFEGQLFLTAFGILYPLARVIEEFYRDYSIKVLGIVPLTYIFCFLCMVVTSFIFYCWLVKSNFSFKIHLHRIISKMNRPEGK